MHPKHEEFMGTVDYAEKLAASGDHVGASGRVNNLTGIIRHLLGEYAGDDVKENPAAATENTGTEEGSEKKSEAPAEAGGEGGGDPATSDPAASQANPPAGG